MAVQLFSKLSSAFLHCGSVLSRCFYLKTIAWLRTKGDRNKACLQNWAKYRAARHHQREVSAHLTQIRHLTQNCRKKHGHRLHKQTALDEPDTNPGHKRWSLGAIHCYIWQNLLLSILLQSPPRKTAKSAKSAKWQRWTPPSAEHAKAIKSHQTSFYFLFQCRFKWLI